MPRFLAADCAPETDHLFEHVPVADIGCVKVDTVLAACRLQAQVAHNRAYYKVTLQQALLLHDKAADEEYLIARSGYRPFRPRLSGGRRRRRRPAPRRRPSQ